MQSAGFATAGERIISQEVCVENRREKEVNVPSERIVEKLVTKPKEVERTTIIETPVVQKVYKTCKVVKEVPVEKVVKRQVVRKRIIERIIEKEVQVVKEVPVERIVEQVVEVIKEVPVEKVIERTIIKEVPVVETEEKVIEVIKEVPVNIVKEVPVYIKSDLIEYEKYTIETAEAAYPVEAGVGMLLGKSEGFGADPNIHVLELLWGGPARECGKISINDILMRVDGKSVSHMNLHAVHNLIRGPPDTPVSFDFIRRAGREDDNRYSVTLYRRQVNQEVIGATEQNTTMPVPLAGNSVMGPYRTTGAKGPERGTEMM
eukprot:CAMPEP_0181317798 /NCGR_PEP_ID=MMETSP1101-20121128/16662_1 /TAXON_ID=46948 /ORGANISM="Rhodomonas abbreviata, Strain Caron Lab Isolate" /LENGTH=317 /DNA_ID=CAMNT_0023425219 /DNA_START=95 /DNA_END=1048 /DNA_ORIENTATION=-